LGGALPNPKIAYEGEAGIMAPDLLMAMATRRGEQWKTLMSQGSSWCRQNQLFPLPATKWMTSRLGDYEPAALGFYGSPWIWDLSWGGKGQQ